ncbi:MAG: class I SAM-dependent methyltransferase [Anaerolineae bacterium]|jgi:SAM-dependent methyltransferase
MTHWKERAKRVLRTVGLYETARRLWDGRPDLQTVCRNAGYRLAGAPDGLPIPPLRLIYLAILSAEVSWFLRSGRFGQESILRTLERNELRMEGFGDILDFGCGCGRLIRHWRSLEGPRLYGTDYNPEMIAWCRQKLANLAEFRVNQLDPPLDYPAGLFDFIYAISVFTHLPEDLQQAWMSELTRILKPGGYLLITVHGESRLHQLTPEEQAQFRAGQLVIKRAAEAGTNICGAYHPHQYVQNRLAGTLKVVDFIPRGSRDTDQDIFLLHKPEIVQ